MKRQYLVKDINKVDDGAKYLILMEELKGPLENAVDSWCMANGKNSLMPVGVRSEENIKAIEDKINELLKLT